MKDDELQITLPELSPKTKKLALKILIIIIALAVLQLPLFMVKNLAAERQDKSFSVQGDIAKSWGGPQTVQLQSKAASEQISAVITPEIRYRGIYQAIIYTSKILISAEYKNLAKPVTGAVKLTDPKGIAAASVSVNGKSVEINNDLEFALPQGDSKCEIALTLRGSGHLKFAPGAENSNIVISGKWSSPSFTGTVLPEMRSIDTEKFSAEWNLNKFNRDIDGVGAALCVTAGTYQQVERCFNYATFFLVVFFFTLLASELITKVNIHVLQYLVASGAPVLFYLMTLALAEHIGFTAGYTVSAAVIVLMVTMYAKMFLGKILPALVMGVIFGGSYLLNYLILRMEDFALLSGTVILALILGVLMALTSKINRKEETARHDEPTGKQDTRLPAKNDSAGNDEPRKGFIFK